MENKKIIFLDKDGTIIPDIPYNVDPNLIELYPDARAALPILADFGYEFVIVTNQAGVEKGYFDEQDLCAVKNKIELLFKLSGVKLLDFYYCPHSHKSQHEACTCRKPSPGMLFQAANEYEFNLSQCWMIGDILNDVEAGNRASCKTILIDRGNESFENRNTNEYRLPDLYETNFVSLAYSLIHHDIKVNNHAKNKINSIL